jgi:hypothetical protein
VHVDSNRRAKTLLSGICGHSRKLLLKKEGENLEIFFKIFLFLIQVTLIEGKSVHEATWWHDIFVSYFFLVLENVVGRSSYSVFQSSRLNMLIPAFVSLFQVVLTHELFLQHFNLKTRPSFIS